MILEIKKEADRREIAGILVENGYSVRVDKVKDNPKARTSKIVLVVEKGAEK